MIKAEFGIIDEVDYFNDYGVYEPEKYNCIAIDDDIYINNWWSRLAIMKTYFHSMDKPANALARWGVTLISPQSLPIFLNIVLTYKRIYTDNNLVDLADKIREAIRKISLLFILECRYHSLHLTRRRNRKGGIF